MQVLGYFATATYPEEALQLQECKSRSIPEVPGSGCTMTVQAYSCNMCLAYMYICAKIMDVACHLRKKSRSHANLQHVIRNKGKVAARMHVTPSFDRSCLFRQHQLRPAALDYDRQLHIQLDLALLSASCCSFTTFPKPSTYCTPSSTKPLLVDKPPAPSRLNPKPSCLYRTHPSPPPPRVNPTLNLEPMGSHP